MTVEIAFTFDGSSLGGKSLVTFEELYDMTNPDEPKKVTEHKDITDDGQTVTIKEVPEVPDTPKDTTRRIHHLWLLRQVTAQKQATIPISMLILPCSVFPA